MLNNGEINVKFDGDFVTYISYPLGQSYHWIYDGPNIQIWYRPDGYKVLVMKLLQYGHVEDRTGDGRTAYMMGLEK
jgi:hypothetical protein